MHMDTHGGRQTSHLYQARHKDSEAAEALRGHAGSPQTCTYTHKSEGFKYTDTEAGIQYKTVH